MLFVDHSSVVDCHCLGIVERLLIDSPRSNAASMKMILYRIKWEVAAHAMCISASQYVASKYSSIPSKTFTNLETILLYVSTTVDVCRASLKMDQFIVLSIGLY